MAPKTPLGKDILAALNRTQGGAASQAESRGRADLAAAVGDTVSAAVGSLSLQDQEARAAAELALTEAAAAMASAATANSLIADITSGDKITPSEKTSFWPQYDALVKEQPGLEAQARAWGVAGAARPYSEAMAVLVNFAIARGIWNAMSATTDLGVNGGVTLRVAVENVLTTKQALLAQITAATQDTIRGLSGTVTDISADDKITAAEKRTLQPQYISLFAERAGLQVQAAAWGVTGELLNYGSALDALDAFAGAVGLWRDVTATTDLGAGGGARLRGLFSTALSSRAALVNAIGEASKSEFDVVTATVNDITADDVISAPEKYTFKPQYDALVAERPGLVAQATTWSVSASSYSSAITALVEFVDTTKNIFAEMSSATELGSGGGALLRALIKSALTEKQSLINALAQAARDQAVGDLQEQYGGSRTTTTINGAVIQTGTVDAEVLKTSILTAGLQVGGANNAPRIVIDGPNERISVSDGTTTRVKLGNLGVGSYGLEIRNAAGGVVLTSGGALGPDVTVDVDGQPVPIGTVAANAQTPTIQMVLSSENLTFTATTAGVTTTDLSLNPVTVTIQVLSGVTDVSANYTFSVVSGESTPSGSVPSTDVIYNLYKNDGTTGGPGNNRLRISAFGTSYSNAYIKIQATPTPGLGYPAPSRTVTLSKSQAGVDGGPGVRGSRTFYKELPNTPQTGVNGGDTDTNRHEAVNEAMALVNGHPVLNDVVTLYSKDYTTPWASTHSYSGLTNGFETWTPIGTVLNGNLLVKGSVSADKIVTGEIVLPGGVISAINTVDQGTGIRISADKVNLDGLVTVTSLADPTSTTTIDGGLIRTGKIIFDNGSFVKIDGVGTITGFGKAPDSFVEWYGPRAAVFNTTTGKVDPGLATKADAIVYTATDGSGSYTPFLASKTIPNTYYGNLLTGAMADGGLFRLNIGGTALSVADNAEHGDVEFATSFAGASSPQVSGLAPPITFAQYEHYTFPASNATSRDPLTKLLNKATLLNAVGDTDFPGIVNAAGFTINGSPLPNIALTTATPGDVGTTAGVGVATAASRADHVHRLTGAVVTSALGYTPYNATNPSGYISAITSLMVTGALGYTPEKPLTFSAPLSRTGDAISHATGNGVNHVPSNGAAGQFLKYASAGTAVWNSPDLNDFTNTSATPYVRGSSAITVSSTPTTNALTHFWVSTGADLTSIKPFAFTATTPYGYLRNDGVFATPAASTALDVVASIGDNKYGTQANVVSSTFGNYGAAFLATGGTATSQNLFMEISTAATSPNPLVPIYIRQFQSTNNNNPALLSHEAILLDASGNTSFPGTITSAGVSVVLTTDSRLSNSRTPTAHAASHLTGGSDAISVVTTLADGLMSKDDKSKLNGIAPGAQPGTVTSVTANAPVSSTGGTAPVISVAVGSSANTVCAGDDTRLFNARTPTAHASTHAVGGSDALSVASTSTAGFMSASDKAKLNDYPLVDKVATPTGWLRSDGTWTTIPAGGATSLTASLADGSSGTAANFITASMSTYAKAIVAAGGTGSNQTAYMEIATSATTPNALAPIYVSQYQGLNNGGTAANTVTLLDSSGNAAFPNGLSAGGQAVVVTTDSRLSNSRTPTSHASSHLTGGSDAIAVVTTLADGLMSASDKSKLNGIAAGAQPGTVTSVTATAPVTSTGGTAPVIGISVGTAANTVCAGNDSRLSDARTPTAHASSHLSGGTDAIALATVSAAGLMPSTDKSKVNDYPLVDKVNTNYGWLRSDGTWQTSVSNSDKLAGQLPSTSGLAAAANTIAQRDANAALWATNVYATSDARLKKDVATVNNALDKVLRLRGVTFTRVDDQSNRQRLGLIAQETQAVAPEVVDTDESGYLAVNYGNLVGLLVEAIRAQTEQIDVLRARVAALEGTA